MILYFLCRYKWGFEFSISQYDLNRDMRVLLSFQIFTNGPVDPWFKYRWSVDRLNGGLVFELGHGTLKSTWATRSPLRRIA